MPRLPGSARAFFAPLLLSISARASSSIIYTYAAGFLDAGNDLPGGGSLTYAQAVSACTASLECMGFTWSGPQNETQPTSPVNMYLKSSAAFSPAAGWNTWLKGSTPEYPDFNATVGGLSLSLRAGGHGVAVLGLHPASDDWSDWRNFSWVPPVRGRALPGCHTLGDVTLRTQPLASSNGSEWNLFSSAWAGFLVPATPLPAPLPPGVLAADDITPLLAATPLDARVAPVLPLGVRVVRSYEALPAAPDAPATLVLRFNVTALADVRVGGFGMSIVSDEFYAASLDAIARVNSLADPHVGGDHGFVELVRMPGNESLLLTPASPATRLEAWRPLLESCSYAGFEAEWTVLSAAWAAEWARNAQAPALAMAPDLAATGVWPPPRDSPWPAWRGGETVSAPGAAARA